ncbi:MAG: hypothetical protein DRP99_03490, partial [Candidatus Latescibacterota bacterium]
ETIGGLFPQFLSFFAPDLAKDVLWDRGYELLDSELHQIASESEETTRYVDRLERLLYEEFHREGVKAMPYVTSWERIAMEKGMKKGMEKGMEKGSLEEAREMVLEALEERFGVVPPDLEEVIRGREDRDVLRKWLRLAIRVGNLEEFRKEAGV